jgi:hypothetical protein
MQIRILKIYSSDKGTDDFSKIIMLATTLGFSAFLSIVLIVLWIKYNRLKRASKLSTPVNIPLETNDTSLEPLPVDEVNYLWSWCWQHSEWLLHMDQF